MTRTHREEKPMNQTESVQWGVMLTLPNGAADVEPTMHRTAAVVRFNALTADHGPAAAQLLYRTTTPSAWREPIGYPGAGNEWGIRITWTSSRGDYTEVHRRDSRLDAERDVRLHRGVGVAEVVTRDVSYGDWQVVAARRPRGLRWPWRRS